MADDVQDAPQDEKNDSRNQTAAAAQQAVSKALAAFLVSPQAFAAKSQFAFGQQEASGTTQ